MILSPSSISSIAWAELLLENRMLALLKEQLELRVAKEKNAKDLKNNVSSVSIIRFIKWWLVKKSLN